MNRGWRSDRVSPWAASCAALRDFDFELSAVGAAGIGSLGRGDLLVFQKAQARSRRTLAKTWVFLSGTPRDPSVNIWWKGAGQVP